MDMFLEDTDTYPTRMCRYDLDLGIYQKLGQ